MPERFELIRELGRGGMGIVHEARDTETGERVALKVLYEQFANDRQYVARMEHEVETQRRVQSPNVVRLLGYGAREGRPYLVMELVEGPSLRKVLEERGPMPWPDALAVFRQALAGLGAAHEAGVLHRDVKPSNILLSPTDGAKLADFGIAKAADLTRLTGTHAQLGTPAYMAPDDEPSVQGDLYSLGCIIYEALAGGPPFEGDSSQQVLMRHLRTPPDLDRVPAEARGVLRWLLEKDARNRPQSARAVLDALASGSMYQRVAAPVAVAAGGGGGHWESPLRSTARSREAGLPIPPNIDGGPFAGGAISSGPLRSNGAVSSQGTAYARPQGLTAIVSVAAIAIVAIIGASLNWGTEGNFYTFQSHALHAEVVGKIFQADNIDSDNVPAGDGFIAVTGLVIGLLSLLSRRTRPLTAIGFGIGGFTLATFYFFWFTVDADAGFLSEWLDFVSAAPYIALVSCFGGAIVSAVVFPQPLFTRVAGPVLVLAGIANGVGLYYWLR